MKQTKKSALSEISESEALAILNKLCKENKNIAKRAGEIRRELLKAEGAESVSESVFSDLDAVDIFEDVYDSSGRTRYGYVEPCERAWEVFEETLEPYMVELKKLKRLKIQSDEYCRGIIKGLKKFKEESTAEYSDLVEDAPDEFIKTVFEEWKKGRRKKEIEKMKEFIKNCGENEEL
ncbi:MAG: hypothetical protein QME12_06385 [Nanoarchaeota archaeon]|nr:hypothetical protein [Nanoarchaeota archaeon]